MKIGIISQARTTSTRLPKKVLIPIKGITVLEHHLNRLQNCTAQTFIATTTNVTDDPIVSICEKTKTPFYRGDENNVLSRYYFCAKENNLDLIIRVTSDCPLIDAEIINKGITTFLNTPSENLYISNCIERTYPRGFDFEIFTFKALEEAYLNAVEDYELEHVTPYINRNKNGRTSFKHIVNNQDKSTYRITLDTELDLTLIQKLINDHNAEEKNAQEIIRILDQHPELVAINEEIKQKPIS